MHNFFKQNVLKVSFSKPNIYMIIVLYFLIYIYFFIFDNLYVCVTNVCTNVCVLYMLINFITNFNQRAECTYFSGLICLCTDLAAGSSENVILTTCRISFSLQSNLSSDRNRVPGSTRPPSP